MVQESSSGNDVSIPGDDDLYRAANPDPKSSHFRSDGTLSSVLFSNTNKTDAMSVDWSAKTTPLETRDRTNWDVDFVVAVKASVYYEFGQSVEYSPIRDWDYTRKPPRPPNPAHCDVWGKKNTKTREIFLEHSQRIVVGPRT